MLKDGKFSESHGENLFKDGKPWQKTKVIEAKNCHA